MVAQAPFYCPLIKLECMREKCMLYYRGQCSIKIAAMSLYKWWLAGPNEDPWKEEKGQKQFEPDMIWPEDENRGPVNKGLNR